MSRIIETGYTISRYPSSILLEKDDFSYNKYRDTAIQSTIAGGNGPAVNEYGVPVKIPVKIAYGLDHAFGFWWDLILCGEKHDNSDDEIIISSTYFWPVGHNVTKSQFLDSFYLMLSDTMLRMTDSHIEDAKHYGGWMEGHQYTMIDPRSLYLILGDRDPERRHMISTGQDGELRMAGILDMVHTYDAQFDAAVREARNINEARAGTFD
tara:strand:+ start:540 stop:1166 length:627 start_codon:yes stop_codon:yes gene_type:complete